MRTESHFRSLVKAISWRVLGTITTGFIVFLFTGEIGAAFAVGGIEALSKILLYFFHERLWSFFTFGQHLSKPAVIWFTGLSGSGKSTIADEVYLRLKKKGAPVERLDGDSVRLIFPDVGFAPRDRNQHIQRVGYLASKLESNGIFVIASLISPYQESRTFVRNLCHNFTEIYLSTPLEECESRDAKGLYSKARRGEIKGFTGIDAPYEKPLSPELEIDTSGVSVDACVEKVMALVESRFLKAPSKPLFFLKRILLSKGIID